MTVLIVLGVAVVVLFVLNWVLAWRSNKTDLGRGPETWQGWDGDGGGAGSV